MVFANNFERIEQPSKLARHNTCRGNSSNPLRISTSDNNSNLFGQNNHKGSLSGTLPTFSLDKSNL
jgi:hypothetical protein